MGFETLIGNESIKQLLQQSVENKRILHSYLFLGQVGIGKALFAKEFAKQILCTQEGNKPCNNCKSCIEFDNFNNPDFYEIKPEDGTIKIETIRLMQTKIIEKPIISQRKVYIIEDADNMTKEAQNCLLKTLEEPPEYITMILTASNESVLLNTIKSRCAKIYFQEIERNTLKEYLQNELGFNDISEEMLDLFEGSISKAIRIRELDETLKQVEKICKNIEQLNLLDVLGKADCLYKNKENIFEILDYMNVIFFKKAKQNARYIKYIKEIEKTKKNINLNANFDMCIDSLLFNLCQ